jgi:hypothetical protein
LIGLDGSCSGSSPNFYAVYGKSAAAPSFASIVALINQKTGARQGQLAPELYYLAASESLSGCNGSNTAAWPAANCIFHDVTIGTNAVPGEANYNTRSESYPATTGFDLASGLGSVNIANLVNSWHLPASVPLASLAPTAPASAGQMHLILPLQTNAAPRWRLAPLAASRSPSLRLDLVPARRN